MTIDLIHKTISYYIIHFWMAKVHECPLAAVCTAVSGEAWKAVALGSFDCSRPQTWWESVSVLKSHKNPYQYYIQVQVTWESVSVLPWDSVCWKLNTFCTVLALDNVHWVYIWLLSLTKWLPQHYSIAWGYHHEKGVPLSHQNTPSRLPTKSCSVSRTWLYFNLKVLGKLQLGDEGMRGWGREGGCFIINHLLDQERY